MYLLRGNYNLLNDFQNIFGESLLSSKVLKTDIIEEDERYVLNIEVPGILKEDIELDFNDNYLTIVVNNKKEEDKLNYLRKERVNGSYSRSYYLDMADQDKITAKLDNGILIVTVGKQKIVDNKRTIFVE